jgi:hypothetical protein
MLLLGLAFSLAYGPLTIAAIDGVAEGDQGLAGGLLNSAFQFGAALGISAVTAVHVAALDADPSAALGAFRTALVVPVAAAVLAALITSTGLRRRAGAAAPEPVGV